MTLAGLAGPRDGSTGAGRLAATTALTARTVTVHTGDGGISLAFSQAPSSVTARSGDGRITVAPAG